MNASTTMNMNTNKTIPAPLEDAFGFFGTIKTNENLSDAEAAIAWGAAIDMFRTAPWEPTDEAIVFFLRSRDGRHFADALLGYEGDDIADRIQQAAGENWVARSMKNPRPLFRA